MFNQHAGCRRNFLKRVSATGAAGLIGAFSRPLGASAGNVSHHTRDVSLDPGETRDDLLLFLSAEQNPTQGLTVR